MAFYWCVHRAYRRYHRPWYRHPRWHIRHWQVQVHVWQTFKRWAFSRCAGCGKRFSWGYCPTSHGMGGHGPSLRGEPGVYHSECSNVAYTVAKAEQAAKQAEGPGSIHPATHTTAVVDLASRRPEGSA